MDYKDYAKHIGADQYLLAWVDTTLANFLEKNKPPQEEVEHILDFLVQTNKKISRMSYPEAAKNATAWGRAQQKKGISIVEKPEDTETVLDFGDGFRVVKLIGENAYKREGFLMRHCVASYFGRDVEVYSLRDKDNMPHCTMERDQQIKGKGNGDIHPKYVDYVVKFLQYIGMEVGDSEMMHLGYVNTKKIQDTNIDWGTSLYAGKYFPKSKLKEIKDKQGNQYESITLWNAFGLYSFDADLKLKFNFNVENCIATFKKFISAPTAEVKSGGDSSIIAGGHSSIIAGGHSSIIAGGHSSTLAGGDYSTIAGGNSSTLVGRDSSTITGRNYSTIAGRDCSTIACGDSSTLAGGDYSTLVGRDSSTLAGGDYSTLAGRHSSTLVGGDSSTLAGGDSSTITLAGKNAIGIARKNAKICGILGAWMVLAEFDKSNNIVAMHTAKIDGKKYKENTWYSVKDGKLQEWKAEENN